MNKSVAVIIPTYNAGSFLPACLDSIERQDIGREAIEIIIVDAGSTDNSIEDQRERADVVLVETPPNFDRGEFGAPWQRARGAEVASCPYLYYFDSDMRMPPGLLSELVILASAAGIGAVVVPEHSIGQGVWADAKAFERDCYFGSKVEAARFFSTEAWNEVGGLDWTMGPCDDWDLHSRVLSAGFAIERASNIVVHNEGKPSLRALARKRFRYGKELHKAITKYGLRTTASYFSPANRGYVRLFREARLKPVACMAFILMRITEYVSGGIGLIVGQLSHRRVASPCERYGEATRSKQAL